MSFRVTQWSELWTLSLIPKNQLGCRLALEWLVLLGVVLCGVVLWSVLRRRGEWGWRRLLTILTLRWSLALLFLGILSGVSFRYQRLEYPLLLVICDDSESMNTRDTEANHVQNVGLDSFHGDASGDSDGPKNGTGGVSSATSSDFPDVAELSTPSEEVKLLTPSRWDQLVSLWNRKLDSPQEQWLSRYRVRWTTLSHLMDSETTDADMTGTTDMGWSQTPRILKESTAKYPETPLGDAIRVAISQSLDDSPVAMVLQTDGIVTRGTTLAQASELASRAGIPLFFIEMGSEILSQDLGLTRVSVDDTIFLGETVGIDATLTAVGFPAAESIISASKQGETTNASVNITNESAYRVQWRREDTSEILGSMPIEPMDGTPIHFTWKPKEAGDFPVVLEILRNEEEPKKPSSQSSVKRRSVPFDTKPENDSWRTTVHVREELIRVLMIQDEPGFEYRFLRNLLVRDPMIEFHAWLQSADPESPQQDPVLLSQFPSREELNRYDVVILGDASSERFTDLDFEHLRSFISEPQNRRSILVIAGPHHWPDDWTSTPLAALLPIYPERLQTNVLTQSLQTTSAGSVHSIFSGTPLAQTPFVTSEPSNPLPDVDVAYSRFSPVLDWSLTSDALRAGAMVLAETRERQEVSQSWNDMSETDIQAKSTSLSQRLQNFLSGRDSLSSSPPVLMPLPNEHMQQGASRPALILHYVGPGQVLYQGFDSTWRWRNDYWDGSEESLHTYYWNHLIRYLARGRLFITASPLELSSDAANYRMGETVRLRLRLTDRQRLPAGTDSVSLGLIAPSGRVTQLIAPLTTSTDASVLGFETSYTVPPQISGRFHVQLRTPLLASSNAQVTPRTPHPSTSVADSAPTASSETLIPSCEFTVLPAPQEKDVQAIDFDAMRLAAERSGGATCLSGEESELWSQLPQGETVRFMDETPSPLWNTWWWLGLFFTLLCLDFCFSSTR